VIDNGYFTNQNVSKSYGENGCAQTSNDVAEFVVLLGFRAPASISRWHQSYELAGTA
jgi:hypothetical protein